ncbi:MAG: FHA domain-containing protein [Chloroflexi bacterium]|nr:FHA domain-containing protein [Chloroflexota bacterium]
MDEVKQENHPFLIIYKGALAGTRWPLDSDTVTIGRGSDCDIVMLERQISRYHVRIERDERGYLLRDLGSKNGTFVNDEPVREQPYRLRDGDEINLAKTVQMGFVAGDATLPLESLEGESAVVSEASDSELKVHPTTRRVCLGREELDPPLSPAQFALLDLLASSGGRVVTRQEIIETVWPDAVGGVTDQAVDALVYRLRERLAELNPDHEYVVTVRGHGLRFEQVE